MNHVTAKSFSGFNLLACDGKELWWMSNRNGTPRRLESGLYGLGNLLLDSPDVDDHKARLKAAIAPAPSVEPLFQVLARAKIVNERYGTRCSTVVMQGKDGRTQFAERPYDAGGLGGETLRYEWQS